MVKLAKRAFKSSSKKPSISVKPFKPKHFVHERKTSRVRRYTHASLKHSILASAIQPDGYRADEEGQILIDARVAVMRNLITHSNKYFNLGLNNGVILPLGTSDGAQSLSNNITRAIQDKHTRIIKDLSSNDTEFYSKRPLIEYVGISVTVHMGEQDNQVMEKVFPMCYYQPHAGSPMAPIVFSSKHLYLKFPKQVEGTNITRTWPMHLSFFNLYSATLKIYYRVMSKAGLTQEANLNQNMVIELPNNLV